MRGICLAVAAMMLGTPTMAQTVEKIVGKAIALDGATLLVTQKNGEPVVVKLWGIAAPTMDVWPWGPWARGALDKFLENHPWVGCEPPRTTRLWELEPTKNPFAQELVRRRNLKREQERRHFIDASKSGGTVTATCWAGSTADEFATYLLKPPKARKKRAKFDPGKTFLVGVASHMAATGWAVGQRSLSNGEYLTGESAARKARLGIWRDWKP